MFLKRHSSAPLGRDLFSMCQLNRLSHLDTDESAEVLVTLLLRGDRLRPRYRRPHSIRLLDLPHLRLLPRLQLPHVAQEQRGADVPVLTHRIAPLIRGSRREGFPGGTPRGKRVWIEL